MADDTARRRLRDESGAARQQQCDRLAAAGRVVLERIAPGADLGGWDLLPRPTVPVTEIQLDQAHVDMVTPTPACQPGPDLGTAPQWRRDDHAR